MAVEDQRSVNLIQVGESDKCATKGVNMKNIYCLLFFLVFPSIVFAADNDVTIKLKGLPVDGIEWGSSPQQLKIDPKELECEQIKPNEEYGTQGSTECSVHVKYEGRSIWLWFTNNRLRSISISSKPTDISNELAYYNDIIGTEFIAEEPHGDVSGMYNWESQYQEYRLHYDKSTGRCLLDGRPSLYAEISIKPPTKERFKLLNLTLGYSTFKDFIQIANSNKWKWIEGLINKRYYVDNIEIDEVVLTVFEFVDDKLESIVYEFGSKKVKTDYFNMLTKKYGKPKEDNGSYVVWKTNKDTRDEITIGLGYKKTHDIIEEIWYRHDGLSFKSMETRSLEIRAKIQNKEKVFQKAF